MIYARLDYRQPLKGVFRFDTGDGFPLFRLNRFAFPRLNASLNRAWVEQYEKLYAAYRAECGKPDLIHAHRWSAGSAAMAIARRENIPYVVTEHLSAFIRGDLAARHIRVLREVFDKAAAVVAVSRGLREKMEKYTSNERLLVIPNLVDTDFFVPAMPAEQKKSDTFRLISIGDPWYTKGVDLLIGALQRAGEKGGRRLELRLGDEIPDRAVPERLIRQYGLAGQVIFTGKLTREEVRREVQRSDLYVSGSRWESFGLTMAEAMSCGVPVVATRTCGATDIVSEDSGLLVPREDPDALAAAILDMASGRWRRPPEKIRQEAVRRFGKEVVTAQLRALYRSVAG